MKVLLGVSIAIIGLSLAWDAYLQGHIGAALIFGAATCMAVLGTVHIFSEK